MRYPNPVGCVVMLSSASSFLHGAPSKGNWISVDVHTVVWLKLFAPCCAHRQFGWNSPNQLIKHAIGATSAVIFRQGQTLLPNEEVSSQSCDMDEGGLASMPGLCTKIIKDKEKKLNIYSQTLHFYIIWAVWPFDVCFWPEGDILHLFACTVSMKHNEAWENLHCGWCKTLHFFVSLERRKDIQIHFKEQSPFSLAPKPKPSRACQGQQMAQFVMNC